MKDMLLCLTVLLLADLASVQEVGPTNLTSSTTEDPFTAFKAPPPAASNPDETLFQPRPQEPGRQPFGDFDLEPQLPPATPRTDGPPLSSDVFPAFPQETPTRNFNSPTR